MNNRVMKTILNIDLLKGNGIPVKSGLTGIALGVITIAVPILIGISMTEVYARNNVIRSLKKDQIKTLDQKIAQLSDALGQRKAIEREEIQYNACLSEVYTKITKFYQWSPILSLLIENIPDSVILTELTVEQDTVKKKVPDIDDPEIMIEIDDLVTTLRIKVGDISESNNDNAVKEFRDYFCSSDMLGPKLEKTEVSKETGTLGGKDVVYYMIDCVFKSGI